MGFNISGIAIDKNFSNNLEDLQKEFNWELDFIEEISFEEASGNWKDPGTCDIYFIEKGTLLFLDTDMCTDAWSISNGNTFTFVLSEASMAFSFNYCKGHNLQRSFMEVNGDRISEEGKKLPVEEKGDASAMIWSQLEIVLGKSFWNIDPSEKARRYTLKTTGSKPAVRLEEEKPAQEQTPPAQKPYLKEVFGETTVYYEDDPKTDTIFDALTNEDDNAVLDAVNKLTETDINSATLAYILNLSYFHRLGKVRTAAKKKLTTFAPADLILQIQDNWKDSYLKQQEFYVRGLYNHAAINIPEFLLFAQVTRKNYYLVKPKTGMVAYTAMRYNDEVEHILDYYFPIEKIPAKVSKQRHIHVANFRGARKLDVPDTIEKLTPLPELHFLQIANSDLQELPRNIEKLSNLRTLIIEENPIREFPSNIIFPKVEKLDIQRTGIRNIDIRQFPSLQRLIIDPTDLDNTSFTNVDHDVQAYQGIHFIRTIPKQ